MSATTSSPPVPAVQRTDEWPSPPECRRELAFWFTGTAQASPRELYHKLAKTVKLVRDLQGAGKISSEDAATLLDALAHSYANALVSEFSHETLGLPRPYALYAPGWADWVWHHR